MANRNNTKYKNIIVGIKDMITDGRGRMVYMDAFDNCINEIFGVPHFSRKLNGAYSNREIIDIIERVGSDCLYEIFTNKRLRGILKEMTEIDRRIHVLRKELRKQGKHGKRDKYDLKEYNWLRKTLKNSAKYMRDRFGIKNRRTAYKKRYKNITDVLRDRDDDFEFRSVAFGDDDYDDVFYSDDYEYNDSSRYDDEDDDDDYDETSELQDFEEMMNGRSSRRRSNRRRRRPSRSRRSSMDFDDEWSDEDDDDEDDEKFVDDDLEKKVDELSKNMMYLAETVQYLSNKSTNDSARIRNLRDHVVKDMRRQRCEEENGYNFAPDNMEFPKHAPNTKLETEVDIINDFIGKLGNDVITLKKNNKVMAEAMDKILEQQSNIVDTFNAILADDDDEDDVDYSVSEAFTHPKVVQQNSLDALVNHVQDPYEMDNDTKEDVVDEASISGTVGELIDKINKNTDSTGSSSNNEADNQ